MIIEFAKSKHERLVNDFGSLCKKVNDKGEDNASEIIVTLNILKAADTLYDVPRSYRPHPLKGVYKGCFAVDVTKKHRVIFKPNHSQDENPEFRIDNFKSIKSIIVIEIFKDYH